MAIASHRLIAVSLLSTTLLTGCVVWKSDYDKLSNADKVNFKEANIIVKSIDKVNDSLSHFTYSNSYKNVQQTINIVRSNGQWLVDLKYLFEHDMDTSKYNQRNKIDTIQK